MTEQEAREKAAVTAEEWILDVWQPRLKAERNNTAPFGSMCTVQDAYKDGYLRCWRDMHSGEPEAWIAVNSDGEFMLATCCYDEFHATSILRDQLDASDLEAEDGVWQVVPVKLLRMEVGE